MTRQCTLYKYFFPYERDLLNRILFNLFIYFFKFNAAVVTSKLKGPKFDTSDLECFSMDGLVTMQSSIIYPFTCVLFL